MKQTYQHGAAHVVAIISLVLALVAALGWIFWQNFMYKTPVTKETETVTVEKPQTEDATGELAIKELGLTISETDGLYNDLAYTMTRINKNDKNNYVAAIYSKSLRDKLIKDANVTSSDNYEINTCNRAVYAFYHTGSVSDTMPGDAIDPANKPANAKLFVGFTGPCTPSTQQLTDESIEFRDWVVKNIK